MCMSGEKEGKSGEKGKREREEIRWGKPGVRQVE